MITIAVTGGIACGKSTAARFMAEDGVPVCDADELAHAALEPGTPVYRGVVGHFGSAILDPQGRIDRASLGRRVFADDGERATLNRLVHPYVIAGYRRWVRGMRPAGRTVVVVLPLLYEAGLVEEWSAVVCVSALRRTQLHRLQRRGHDEAEARRRIAAQMPLREKEARADYVIVNEGTMDVLRRQTRTVLQSITERYTW